MAGERAAQAGCHIARQPCPGCLVLQATDVAAAGDSEPPLIIYEIGGGTGTLALNILVSGGRAGQGRRLC